MTDATVYVGKDLEAMSFSVNYHRWILDRFRPFVGEHVVEVGAGTGGFSELLLELSPRTLDLVEPSNMFEQLRENISGIEAATRVTCHNEIFSRSADDIVSVQRPDTIVYVNVLEHIRDDSAELRLIHDSLAPGGHALIFVPALMALFSAFDRKIGHFRRYTRPELEEKCRTAGFEIVRSGYFDLAGILPWFIKFRIVGSHDLDAKAVRAYDRFAVPVVSRVENTIPVPLGKNVLLVARRPA